MNREEWLSDALTYLIQAGQVESLKTETIKISCGYGYRCRGGKTAVKVYTPVQSQGGNWEIFINPQIDLAGTALQAVWQGIREMDKAMAGSRRFRLTERHPDDVHVPDYPHDALDIGKVKKQTTRYLKAECPDRQCGFIFRTSRQQLQKAIDSVGGVACPVCQSDMYHGVAA
jgi:hypothetical protein